MFTASYSGLFKSFFDVLGTDVLAGKPVLIGATGGTERHSLVLDHAMRPLFAYLHASVVPTGVYAASTDWGAGEGALSERIEQGCAAARRGCRRVGETPEHRRVRQHRPVRDVAGRLSRVSRS